MMKINYKSDFDFILRLKDCQGKYIGWPKWDFTAKFHTTQKAIYFEAWKRGNETHNCYEDNGAIHIVANSHGLGKGRLNVEFTAELPNGIYPDGSRRVVSPVALDIELTTDAQCPIPDMEAEATIPIAIQKIRIGDGLGMTAAKRVITGKLPKIGKKGCRAYYLSKIHASSTPGAYPTIIVSLMTSALRTWLDDDTAWSVSNPYIIEGGSINKGAIKAAGFGMSPIVGTRPRHISKIPNLTIDVDTELDRVVLTKTQQGRTLYGDSFLWSEMAVYANGASWSEAYKEAVVQYSDTIDMWVAYPPDKGFVIDTLAPPTETDVREFIGALLDEPNPKIRRSRMRQSVWQVQFRRKVKRFARGGESQREPLWFWSKKATSGTIFRIRRRCRPLRDRKTGGGTSQPIFKWIFQEPAIAMGLLLNGDPQQFGRDETIGQSQADIKNPSKIRCTRQSG